MSADDEKSGLSPERPFAGNAATTEALARFGFRAGTAVKEMAAPLEILTNILYLARGCVTDAAKLSRYLIEAQAVADGLCESYAQLLQEDPLRSAAKSAHEKM